MLIGAIILAGGESERMGRSKASLEWRGSSLLGDRVAAMLDCAYPVVVVARDREQELPPLDTECEVVFDGDPSGGPLVAVLAGLGALADRCDAAVVIGCDFPFVDARVVAWLGRELGERAGAVPTDGGTPQPLCAIYRTSLLPGVRGLVERGERAALALLDLDGVARLDEAAVAHFDPERRFLWNVNTEADYEQALQWSS